MIDYEDMVSDLQKRLEKEKSIKSRVLIKNVLKNLNELKERQ